MLYETWNFKIYAATHSKAAYKADVREKEIRVPYTTHISRICNILQKPLQKFSHSSKTSYVPKYSHKEQKTYLSPSNRLQFNMFFFPHHSPLTTFFQRAQSFQQQTTNVNYGIPICLCPQITIFVISYFYKAIFVKHVVFNGLNFLCLPSHIERREDTWIWNMGAHVSTIQYYIAYPRSYPIFV